MKEAIKNLSLQFQWQPEIKNTDKLKIAESFVVAGMGGSNLSSGLLKIYNPVLDLYIHRDYGLPPLSDEKLKNSLLIASSYSGNTEEVLDFTEKALKEGLDLAVISTGGKLLELAKKNNLPFIELPRMVSHPRFGLTLSLKAMAKLIGNADLEVELSSLSGKIDPGAGEKEGRELSDKLANKIPIIYSGASNKPLAYNWKIRFNETSKVPAFCNVFPELNHNEIAELENEKLSKDFHFIFLGDQDDHPKIKKRMDVLEKILLDRSLQVERLVLKGDTLLEKIFNSIVLADWTTFYLADAYGVDPEKIEIIEEFKQKISK